jgi:hypothetical protein
MGVDVGGQVGVGSGAMLGVHGCGTTGVVGIDIDIEAI